MRWPGGQNLSGLSNLAIARELLQSLQLGLAAGGILLKLLGDPVVVYIDVPAVDDRGPNMCG